MMTGEREKELMSAAGMLLEARRTDTPIDDLPAAVRPVTLEEAYFVQDRLALAYGEIGGGEGGGAAGGAAPVVVPMPRAGVAADHPVFGGLDRVFGVGAGVAFFIGQGLTRAGERCFG